MSWSPGLEANRLRLPTGKRVSTADEQTCSASFSTREMFFLRKGKIHVSTSYVVSEVNEPQPVVAGEELLVASRDLRQSANEAR